MTRIFISHSHVDKKIAHFLIAFLLAALELKSKDIRCSSVEGSQLPFGKTISEQLRMDLNHTTCMIALITRHSLSSNWVSFELGSYWATEKLIVPILAPKLTYEDLPEPLRSYPGVQMDDENPSYRMIDAVNQLSSVLDIQQETNAWRNLKLDDFIRQFKEMS